MEAFVVILIGKVCSLAIAAYLVRPRRFRKLRYSNHLHNIEGWFTESKFDVVTISQSGLLARTGNKRYLGDEEFAKGVALLNSKSDPKSTHRVKFERVMQEGLVPGEFVLKFKKPLKKWQVDSLIGNGIDEYIEQCKQDTAVKTNI